MANISLQGSIRIKVKGQHTLGSNPSARWAMHATYFDGIDVANGYWISLYPTTGVALNGYATSWETKEGIFVLPYQNPANPYLGEIRLSLQNTKGTSPYGIASIKDVEVYGEIEVIDSKILTDFLDGFKNSHPLNTVTSLNSQPNYTHILMTLGNI